MIAAIVVSAIQKVARGFAEKIKLGLLNAMLWGGTILLALEHIWHGEVVPWPPFLTAMSNPADIPVMLHEIATVGSAMTVVTLAVWLAILGVEKISIKMQKPLTPTQITGAVKPS